MLSNEQFPQTSSRRAHSEAPGQFHAEAEWIVACQFPFQLDCGLERGSKIVVGSTVLPGISRMSRRQVAQGGKTRDEVAETWLSMLESVNLMWLGPE
jgi:hypothetical protein